MYTVYKTINNINGKFYIGVHKTDYPYDSYFGSGKGIKDAIKKYGRGNFRKEIIDIFEKSSDAFGLESELVNTSTVHMSECYNMKVGGYGGWDLVNASDGIKVWRHLGGISTQICERIKSLRKDPIFDAKFRKAMSRPHNNSSKGHKISDEVRAKIVESNSNRRWVCNGTNVLLIQKDKLLEYLNAGYQKGKIPRRLCHTCWINNGICNRMIRKDERIPDGYSKGRLMPMMHK